jgi:hypothetical protein
MGMTGCWAPAALASVATSDPYRIRRMLAI